MASALSASDRKLLTILKDRDIVAPWSHADLARLSHRGLVDQFYLAKPNGRAAISKRWSITDAGRAAQARPT